MGNAATKGVPEADEITALAREDNALLASALGSAAACADLLGARESSNKIAKYFETDFGQQNGRFRAAHTAVVVAEKERARAEDAELALANQDFCNRIYSKSVASNSLASASAEISLSLSMSMDGSSRQLGVSGAAGGSVLGASSDSLATLGQASSFIDEANPQLSSLFHFGDKDFKHFLNWMRHMLPPMNPSSGPSVGASTGITPEWAFAGVTPDAVREVYLQKVHMALKRRSLRRKTDVAVDADIMRKGAFLSELFGYSTGEVPRNSPLLSLLEHIHELPPYDFMDISSTTDEAAGASFVARLSHAAPPIPAEKRTFSGSILATLLSTCYNEANERISSSAIALRSSDGIAAGNRAPLALRATGIFDISPSLRVLLLCQAHLLHEFALIVDETPQERVARSSSSEPSVELIEAGDRALVQTLADFLDAAVRGCAGIVEAAALRCESTPRVTPSILRVLSSTIVGVLFPPLATALGMLLRSSTQLSFIAPDLMEHVCRIVRDLAALCQYDEQPSHRAAKSFLSRADVFTLAEQTKIAETPHPYSANTDDTTVVRVPGATHLCIMFDPRCGTDSESDILMLYSGDRGAGQGEPLTTMPLCGRPEGSGTWPAMPLVVEGDAVTLSFKTDTLPKSQWGYRCIIIGLVLSPSGVFSFDLQMTAGRLLADCLAAMLRGEPASDDEARLSSYLDAELFRGGLEKPFPSVAADTQMVDAAAAENSISLRREERFLHDFIEASEGTDARRLVDHMTRLAPAERMVEMIGGPIVKKTARFYVAALLKHSGLLAQAMEASARSDWASSATATASLDTALEHIWKLGIELRKWIGGERRKLAAAEDHARGTYEFLCGQVQSKCELLLSLCPIPAVVHGEVVRAVIEPDLVATNEQSMGRPALRSSTASLSASMTDIGSADPVLRASSDVGSQYVNTWRAVQERSVARRAHRQKKYVTQKRVSAQMSSFIRKTLDDDAMRAAVLLQKRTKRAMNRTRAFETLTDILTTGQRFMEPVLYEIIAPVGQVLRDLRDSDSRAHVLCGIKGTGIVKEKEVLSSFERFSLACTAIISSFHRDSDSNSPLALLAMDALCVGLIPHTDTNALASLLPQLLALGTSLPVSRARRVALGMYQRLVFSSVITVQGSSRRSHPEALPHPLQKRILGGLSARILELLGDLSSARAEHTGLSQHSAVAARHQAEAVQHQFEELEDILFKLATVLRTSLYFDACAAFLQNAEFVRLCFQLADQGTPRLARTAMRMLRHILPSMSPDLLEGDPLLSPVGGRKTVVEFLLERITESTLVDASSTTTMNNLRFTTTRVELNRSLEVIMLLRVLFSSPRWRPAIAPIVSKALTSVLTVGPTRAACAALDILGGATECIRIGGRVRIKASGEFASVVLFSRSTAMVKLVIDSNSQVVVETPARKVEPAAEIGIDLGAFPLTDEVIAALFSFVDNSSLGQSFFLGPGQDALRREIAARRALAAETTPVSLASDAAALAAEQAKQRAEAKAKRELELAERRAAEKAAGPPVPWACSQCTFMNPPTEAICSICGGVRSMVIAVNSAAQSPQQWSCEVCTFYNEPFAANCSMCSSAKPAASTGVDVSPPSTSPVVAAKADDSALSESVAVPHVVAQATSVIESSADIPEPDPLWHMLRMRALRSLYQMMQNRDCAALLLKDDGLGQEAAQRSLEQILHIGAAPSGLREFRSIVELEQICTRLWELLGDLERGIAESTGGTGTQGRRTQADLLSHSPFAKMPVILPSNWDRGSAMYILFAGDLRTVGLRAAELNGRTSDEALRDAAEAILSGDSCPLGIIRANAPIPSTLPSYYFEVELLDPLSRPVVEDEPKSEFSPFDMGIGIYRSGRPLCGPVGNDNSYALTGDGTLLHNAGTSAADMRPGYFPRALRIGDIVGCGWNIRQGDCYFTLNGERLPAAFDRVQGQFMPVAWLRDSRILLRINLGHAPFKYALFAETLPADFVRNLETMGDGASASREEMQRRTQAEELMAMMGGQYPVELCVVALERCRDDPQFAANWLFDNGAKEMERMQREFIESTMASTAGVGTSESAHSLPESDDSDDASSSGNSESESLEEDSSDSLDSSDDEHDRHVQGVRAIGGRRRPRVRILSTIDRGESGEHDSLAADDFETRDAARFLDDEIAVEAPVQLEAERRRAQAAFGGRAGGRGRPPVIPDFARGPGGLLGFLQQQMEQRRADARRDASASRNEDGDTDGDDVSFDDHAIESIEDVFVGQNLASSFASSTGQSRSCGFVSAIDVNEMRIQLKFFDADTAIVTERWVKWQDISRPQRLWDDPISSLEIEDEAEAEVLPPSFSTKNAAQSLSSASENARKALHLAPLNRLDRGSILQFLARMETALGVLRMRAALLDLMDQWPQFPFREMIFRCRDSMLDLVKLAAGAECSKGGQIGTGGDSLLGKLFVRFGDLLNDEGEVDFGPPLRCEKTMERQRAEMAIVPASDPALDTDISMESAVGSVGNDVEMQSADTDVSFAATLADECVEHYMGAISAPSATVTVESEHPYNRNENVRQRIRIRGASKLVIRFDPRCNVHRSDLMTRCAFFADARCQQLLGSYRGDQFPNMTNPLIIDGDSVWFRFTSGGGATFWGYRFLVAPFGPRALSDVQCLGNANFELGFWLMELLLTHGPQYARRQYLPRLYDALQWYTRKAARAARGRGVLLLLRLLHELSNGDETAGLSAVDLSPLLAIRRSMEDRYLQEASEDRDQIHSAHLQSMVELLVTAQQAEQRKRAARRRPSLVDSQMTSACLPVLAATTIRSGRRLRIDRATFGDLDVTKQVQTIVDDQFAGCELLLDQAQVVSPQAKGRFKMNYRFIHELPASDATKKRAISEYRDSLSVTANSRVAVRDGWFLDVAKAHNLTFSLRQSQGRRDFPEEFVEQVWWLRQLQQEYFVPLASELSVNGSDGRSFSIPNGMAKAFTITFWMWLHEDVPTDKPHSVFMKGFDRVQSRTPGLTLFRESGGDDSDSDDDSTPGKRGLFACVSTDRHWLENAGTKENIPLKQWFHVSVWCDGRELRVYVDGKTQGDSSSVQRRRNEPATSTRRLWGEVLPNHDPLYWNKPPRGVQRAERETEGIHASYRDIRFYGRPLSELELRDISCTIPLEHRGLAPVVPEEQTSTLAAGATLDLAAAFSKAMAATREQIFSQIDAQIPIEPRVDTDSAAAAVSEFLAASFTSEMDRQLIEFVEQHLVTETKIFTSVASCASTPGSSTLGVDGIGSKQESASAATAAVSKQESEPKASSKQEAESTAVLSLEQVLEAKPLAKRDTTLRWPLLHSVSPSVLALRLSVLIAANDVWMSAFPYVDFAQVRIPWSFAACLAEQKLRMFSSTKQFLWLKIIQASSTQSGRLRVRISRPKAVRALTKGDADASRSVFGQLFRQLHFVPPSHLRGAGQLWTTEFVGEGGEDAGGLFRDSLAHACSDLQHSQQYLPVLVPVQNAGGFGENQDKWVPNPSATTPLHRAMFQFLGKLMGIAIRTKMPLSLNLPSIVWKQLAPGGAAVNRADIEAIDALFYRALDDVRGMTADEDSSEALMFTVTSTDGRIVELCPGGRSTQVQFGNRHQYCHMIEQYRLHEFDQQCEAIREGLGAIVPISLLSLFSWQDIELMVCGRREVDLQLLRENTRYSSGFNESHTTIKRFWKVLESFDTKERELYLRFVWGRSRLPVDSRDFDQKMVLMQMHGAHDVSLPLSHTCFFQLELPEYSSEDIMREKLLYAITECREIDTDHAAAAVDWDREEDD